jgi:flavin reductase (DIM6/NTAB) family NADH-FMN oxidoreductase RutF
MSCATDPLASRRLRDALGHVATGVVVATALTGDGVRLGMTLNSCASVSLDPPLVLFCIDRRARGLPDWRRVAGWAVNVLAARQSELSNRFARPGADKWRGVGFVPGLHGAPLLDGVCARFECTAHDQLDGGDHVILVGRVERHWADPGSPALVFHRGRYAQLADPLAVRPAPELASWPLPIHY